MSTGGADLCLGQAFKQSAGLMSLGNLRQVRAAPLSAQFVKPPIFSEMPLCQSPVKQMAPPECCYLAKWTMCEGFTVQIVSLRGISSGLVLAVDSFISSDKSSLQNNALLSCKKVSTKRYK